MANNSPVIDKSRFAERNCPRVVAVIDTDYGIENVWDAYNASSNADGSGSPAPLKMPFASFPSITAKETKAGGLELEFKKEVKPLPVWALVLPFVGLGAGLFAAHKLGGGKATMKQYAMYGGLGLAVLSAPILVLTLKNKKDSTLDIKL